MFGRFLRGDLRRRKLGVLRHGLSDHDACSFLPVGHELSALRRIALMACSSLSEIAVDEGWVGGSNAEWRQSRGRCFLNEEPVPVLLRHCKNTHVAVLRCLLFYVYAIAGILWLG